jgi:signal transduction histidine kinase
VVAVEDTGPGIPEEVRAHLFEPFATAGKRSGMGLGLALSRQTVLDHGGDLSVASSTPRGTIFLVTLPANGVKAEAFQAEAAAPGPTNRVKG